MCQQYPLLLLLVVLTHVPEELLPLLPPHGVLSRVLEHLVQLLQPIVVLFKRLVPHLR
jgi:uncharacterized protein YggT (Ycf19 family)